MKCVIVEDDFLISIQIKECVERLGHEVLASFDNAKEAIEFVKDNQPDFVFMDIELNGPIDGIQCANELQNKLSIPSIFVTSHHGSEILNESMYASPLNFLPKPFEDKNIEAAVALAQRVLKNSKNPEVKSSTITLGSYEYNSEFNVLKNEGSIINLTDKELSLISLLFKNIGNTVSKEAIYEHVYDGDTASDDSLRRLVSRSRDKIIGLQIKAEPRQGYYLTV